MRLATIASTRTSASNGRAHRRATPFAAAVTLLAFCVAFSCVNALGQTTSATPAAPTAASVQGAQTSSAPRPSTQSANPSTQAGGRSAGQPGSQNTTQTAAQTAAERAADENAARTAPVVYAPTEFQDLVRESTGQLLPIFGINLFDNVPSTFAPVDNLPVAPDYTIGPGDELRLQVFGQVNQQGTFVVDRNGDIQDPDLGALHVAGLKFSDLEPYFRTQYSRIYRNFKLNVNLGQLRSIQVFVVGSARRPGAYTVSSLSTLLNAIFASGGPLPQGSLRDIQLQRAGQTIVHFDLYDLLLHGDKSKDVPLVPGDVVFIPPVGAQVALSGSIDTPAVYETRPGTTVQEAIKLAGGETAVALGTQVRMERIYEHAMRALADVDLSRYNPVLQNGDIVEVGEILGRYRNAVTLRGNVASPGRYLWRPGMRIADLIPSKDLLVTREYDRRRNSLGTTPLGLAAEAPGTARPGGALQLAGATTGAASDSAVRSGATSTATTSGGSSIGAALTGSNNVFPAVTDVVLSAPDIDWSYAVVERLNQQTLTTSLIPFHPGKLFLEGDQSQNLELLSGDIVTFFSTADLRVPQSQQTRFVRLEGEFTAAGVYSVEPGETLRHLLRRAGGFTPDAYLYGSEFTRQSTRRVQQQRLNEFADSLEAQAVQLAASGQARALNAQDATAVQASTDQANQTVARLRRVQPIGRIVLEVLPDSRTVDDVPDLPLEDGDRFVVPRLPATVAVEGQVYSANAFVFVRGRRERDYLKQAGGPERTADRSRTFILRADGSVFSSQYGNVSHANIFPGDTIVVPPHIDRRAILRNLVDISNVVGGLGLGIAAINLLR